MLHGNDCDGGRVPIDEWADKVYPIRFIRLVFLVNRPLAKYAQGGLHGAKLQVYLLPGSESTS